MKSYSLKDIESLLETDFEIIRRSNDIVFTNVRPINEAAEDSLVWAKNSLKEAEKVIRSTKSKIIICSKTLYDEQLRDIDKCFVLVKDPRLTILRIIDSLFSKKIQYGIHPSAVIHSEAKIHSNAYIGPLTYIGISTIGEGTIIYGNTHIYDNVNIGKNVTIHAGSVIGADGFGYQRNEDGVFEKFPHVGGVIIDDDVEIGANTCIDKGGLGNTHIQLGAKIDNLVHIAHNVIVGKHSAVIANAMVGGSTIIDDFSWVAPSVSLINGIRIGRKVTGGMGAVVTKNIPDGETWTGIPARPLEEFLKQQAKIKNLP